MDALLTHAWDELSLAPRIAAAVVLGGLVGFEREHAERPAGLRTHMLVSGAAALLVVLADVMVLRYADDGNTQLDPIRVMEAIVAGISFIGAGTIFVSGAKHKVRGLTTAASLFGVAAIGIGCGLGLYVLSTVAAVGIVAILRVLAWVEHHTMSSKERLEHEKRRITEEQEQLDEEP